jgi:hypothetical protein
VDNKSDGVSARVAVPGVLRFGCRIIGLTAGYVSWPPKSVPDSLTERKIPRWQPVRPPPGELFSFGF